MKIEGLRLKYLAIYGSPAFSLKTTVFPVRCYPTIFPAAYLPVSPCGVYTPSRTLPYATLPSFFPSINFSRPILLICQNQGRPFSLYQNNFSPEKNNHMISLQKNRELYLYIYNNQLPQ